MLIPYNTDAPLYHWPFATGGLIAANIVSFIAVMGASGQSMAEAPAAVDFLLLQYDQINPLQWITSIFMHVDLIHLLGNMFFLWPFGMIVEGKVGWWRFLIIYFLIGVGQCAVEQVILYGSDGGSLGASSAISGLMAICLVWAPKNEIQCWFLLRWFGAYHFDVPVALMAGGFMAFDFVFAFLTYFNVSTSVLHLMGAGIGVAVGLILVASRRVDCEGYDLISICRGREGVKTLTKEQEAEERAQKVELAQQRREEKQHGLDMIQHYLERGHVEMAVRRWKLLAKESPGTRLQHRQLVAIAQHYLRAKDWPQAVVFLQQIIDQSPENSTQFRVRMAQIYIVEMSRPSKGLEALRPLVSVELDDKTKSLARRLIARAQEMISDGTMEVEE